MHSNVPFRLLCLDLYVRTVSCPKPSSLGISLFVGQGRILGFHRTLIWRLSKVWRNVWWKQELCEFQLLLRQFEDLALPLGMAQFVRWSLSPWFLWGQIWHSGFAVRAMEDFLTAWVHFQVAPQKSSFSSLLAHHPYWLPFIPLSIVLELAISIGLSQEQTAFQWTFWVPIWF